ncbi:taste receptor type 1 member 1-like [Sardina pilchardus]|uniref:taste receptor type 1 member 1-like n=1 Tax=Sardina pilchardus TaxID=27697 RepID=UPI002E0D85ED
MEAQKLFLHQGLQVMRFAFEEINNSTTLLPNITLGYQLIDYCSDAHNFPAILQFLSVKGYVKPRKIYNFLPKVIGLIGAFNSHESKALAPLVMMDLIPMVSYSARSSALNNKRVYPSFVRTIPSNTHQIELIIHIIEHFNWNWVAFIGSKSANSQDGLQLFKEMIHDKDISLAYHELLSAKSQLNTTFENIDKLKINAIVLFIEPHFGESILSSAIELNFHGKVWITSDAWSMNQLSKRHGTGSISTIIGVTPTAVPFPGFNEFIYHSKHRAESVHSPEGFCNQACDNCSSVSSEDVINENPTYSFPIYSAVYTMAMALHNVLQCNHSGCNKTHTVYPYMLLEEIKRLQFLLNKVPVSFDKNLDAPAHYSILFWDTSYNPVKIRQIGTYTNYPVSNLTIFNTLLQWPGSGLVPFSNCSAECKPGYVRQQEGQHQCCFTCLECPSNQYANHTANLYSCLKCGKYEWSDAGSTSCRTRSMEYLRFSDGYSIVLMVLASALMLLCVGVAMLFAVHRSTPVVRSAGGSMCFLMLGCLAAAATSVFFYFDKPTPTNCMVRNIVYAFFYTVCVSCLLVRSFQIICIFKMAALLPKVHAWWVKHNGQWLVVAAPSLLQLLLCAVWMTTTPPLPVEEKYSFKDQVVLICLVSNIFTACLCNGLMWILSGLCFWFSYMGTDLPKNYNEGKAITFSMVMFCLSWASYITAYLSSHCKYIQVVKIVVELSCLYGILFCYFIPKSFIIVFQPQKNTQEYFQNAIQSYTKTISRT